MDRGYVLARNASFAARFIHALLRSRLRGQTRLTLFLSHRIRSLQLVEVRTPEGRPLYLDLRIGSTHSLMAGLPYEAEEQQVMRNVLRLGDVAFDVGAHLGVHTVLMASIVGPSGGVVAFEPNPRVFALLERTLNQIPHARALPFALSDQSGTGTLFVPPIWTMASLANWTADRGWKSDEFICEVRSLGALVESHRVRYPHFIKCDVEGAELKVLHGAAKILDRVDAPVIMFEAGARTYKGFGFDINDSTQFLSSLSSPKYEFFEISDGCIHRVGAPMASHVNILAMPAAKRGRWPELSLLGRVNLG